MPAFKYKALDKSGKETTGVIEADSPKHARQKLNEKDLIPLDVYSISEKQTKGSTVKVSRSSGKLKTAELALIMRQLATLLDAAMPVEEALKAVAEQNERPKVKSLLLSVRAQVLEGMSFSKSLEKFPRSFPSMYTAAVDAGEQSGHLNVVLVRLADHCETQQEIQQKVGQALIYPAIMTFVSLLIVTFLLIYVVPKMIHVFNSTNQTLPLLTQILVEISHLIAKFGIYALIAIIVLIFLFIQGKKKPGFKQKLDAIYLKLPLFGASIQKVNVARYSRTLGILLSASVPLLEAMRISTQLVTNIPMQKQLLEAVQQTKEGIALSTALKATKRFPPMSIHLIASGEKSGSLSEMLERAAHQQEGEVSRLIDTLLTLFEPALILVMGGVVLFIVLAVLLPIFSLDQFTG